MSRIKVICGLVKKNMKLLTFWFSSKPQALPLRAYRTANLMGSRRKYVRILNNQITPVHLHPIFSIPANLTDETIADIKVATYMEEKQGEEMRPL